MAISRPEDIARLMEILRGFEEFPGRAPGGSGPTGIGRASAIGHAPSGGLFPRQTANDYDQMVREQNEYLTLTGNEPTRVRHDVAPNDSGSFQAFNVRNRTDELARRDAIRNVTGRNSYR